MWSAAVLLPARSGAQDPREGFVGVAQKAQDRVVAEPAFEVRGCHLLLGVDLDQGGVMSSTTCSDPVRFIS